LLARRNPIRRGPTHEHQSLSKEFKMSLDILKRLRVFGAVALLGFGLAACGSDDDDVFVPPPAPKNIVEVAQGNPDLSILVEAVVAADLVDTLSSPGPFTVFAPTNDAFVKLLGELGVTKDELLADTALLTRVLTYHVLAVKVPAADVAGVLGKAITTVETGIFKIDDVAGELTITDESNRTSKITATDVEASNGVIHLIDTVILPSDNTVVDVAIAAAPEFSTLVELVVAANLAGVLSGDGPFTVFAPTNQAFVDFEAATGISKADLLNDIPLLAKVLTYHVVPARVLKAEVPLGAAITTVQGETFAINVVGDALQITDANARSSGIVAADVMAGNGVIHVIDTVILPLLP